MLIPTSDRIIISKTEIERKTEGGIIIPNTTSEQSIKGNFNTGVVVAVSSEFEKTQEVKVGDKVYYHIGSGITFDHDGKQYIIMRICEIYMVEKK